MQSIISATQKRKKKHTKSDSDEIDVTEQLKLNKQANFMVTFISKIVCSQCIDSIEMSVCCVCNDEL